MVDQVTDGSGKQPETRPDPESGGGGRQLEGTLLGRIAFWIGVALSAVTIYLNTLGTFAENITSAIHWGGFGLLCALIYPAVRTRSGAARRAVLGMDILIGLAVVACAAYLPWAFDAYYDRGLTFIWSDWVMSIAAILLALELVRRTAGLFIPIMTVIGLTYVFWWGSEIGGVFRFAGLSLETVLYRSYIDTTGMFGQIARISSTVVVMFIIFGAFLIRSGAGNFVIDVARAVAGRMQGGPGFIAVIGSALTGTVSGSAMANTTSTGVITIPLMKKAGFPPQFAAGVEASASTGGQLMPPIMGAGAFVMANYTQIDYLTIVAVSVLPALLYFFSVGVWVRIEARKNGLGRTDEAPPRFFEIMRQGGISFLLPIALLVGLLIAGFTPEYCAGAAILAVIASSWLTPNPMGPRAILEALSMGARNMVTAAMLLVSVGLIVMVVETTGIGNTLSIMLSDWADGNLLIALVLIALASLVLGMGLPVTAAYIVLGTLSAPALYGMIAESHLVDLIASGQLPEAAKPIFMLAAPDRLAALSEPMSRPDAQALLALVPLDFKNQLLEQALDPDLLMTALLSAHMIIFWLSQDSNVTPPVCLTAFAAAAIAGTPPMRTGLTAWRIAKGLYIVPVLFAYTPFLSGDWLKALEIFAFGAVAIYALAGALDGYLEDPVAWPFRPVLGIAGIALLWQTSLLYDLVAVVAVIAIFVATRLMARNRSAVPLDR